MKPHTKPISCSHTNQWSPVSVRATAMWDGIRLQHCQVRQRAAFRQCHPEHLIAIPLAGSFTAESPSITGYSAVVTRMVGHTCIVPAGQSYTVHFDEEVEYVALYLDPMVFTYLTADCHGSTGSELVLACDAHDPLIRHIALALQAEAAAPATWDQLYVDSLTHALIVHLFKQYTGNSNHLSIAEGGLSVHLIRRATEFIEAHLATSLTLADIAAAVGLSPFHFARAFKHATGTTVHQYVLARRIQYAAVLLAQPDLSLVDVSSRAGFKSQSHFTTVFRKRMGITPNGYRHTTLQ